MENEEITMDIILSVFKNSNDVKTMKSIKDLVVSKMNPEKLVIEEEERLRIGNIVADLIAQDKKKGEESELRYRSGKYAKRAKRTPPVSPKGILDTRYIGTAGECAVISELMFSGYNANRMMIDDGVDIIAVKDNIYYYVQVKTTSIKANGTICTSINLQRHNQYMATQIRYVIVVRYKDRVKNKDVDRNMFFSFTPQIIEQGMYNRCIKAGENNVSIKIKFNEKTGEPFLYDEKEFACGYNWNPDDLLK